MICSPTGKKKNAFKSDFIFFMEGTQRAAKGSFLGFIIIANTTKVYTKGVSLFLDFFFSPNRKVKLF